MPGMLRKSTFRMIGTAVGALAAVVLTAVFPQDRSAFLFTIVAWASACTFLSTLLRNFAAYAAILAGYTLIIVVSTSIAAPDQAATGHTLRRTPSLPATLGRPPIRPPRVL